MCPPGEKPGQVQGRVRENGSAVLAGPAEKTGSGETTVRERDGSADGPRQCLVPIAGHKKRVLDKFPLSATIKGRE